jgi:Ca2+-binding protein (EF-Hand superfamily)
MNNPKKHGTHERRQSNPTIGKIEENTKLSKSEIDELREHFKAFDKGNTGSINRTDVIEVLKGNVLQGNN